MQATNASRTRHARANDRLIEIPEIAETIRMPEATVRYKRHKGELPFIFKMSRRVVAWESDVLDYVESFRLAQQAERADG